MHARILSWLAEIVDELDADTARYASLHRDGTREDVCAIERHAYHDGSTSAAGATASCSVPAQRCMSTFRCSTRTRLEC